MATRPEGLPAAAVAVAASAGGVETLTAFVRNLPDEFDAAVLVVLHLSETGPSVLPSILARACRLRVLAAEEDVELQARMVVVAPPGQHLRVQDHHAMLDRGPRENGHRPSADALFRSVADAYGHRAAGVVLSGTMDDGAAGLRAIGCAGGLTVVQDPGEATFAGMPRAAIAEAHPAVVCRVAEMAERLTAWLDELALHPRDPADLSAVDPEGVPAETDAGLSRFTCPECGGTLWVDRTYGVEQFRCRVGHTYSTKSLLAGKHDAVEAALWAAIVALEERADLSRRLLKRLEGNGRPMQLQRYRDDIEQAADRIEILRAVIGGLVEHGVVATGLAVPTGADRELHDGSEEHDPDPRT